MAKCEYCGAEVLMPFKCNYCQGIFCQNCRLPETHQCTHLVVVRSQRKEFVYGPGTPSTDHKRKSPLIRILGRRSSGGWFRQSGTDSTGYRRSEPWRMMGGITTGNEALDILVAAALIFGVFFVSVTSSIGFDKNYLTGILLTILTGFIGHELAHRSIARRSGLQARFVLWTQGIILTLLGFVLRFALIVPGFVFMMGYVSKTVNGKVALSGPAINIVNGVILAVLWALTNVTVWGIHFDTALHLAAQLNFFLALFNLIPLGPLDGKKVREWNPKIWALSLGIALLMWLVLYAL